ACAEGATRAPRGNFGTGGANVERWSHVDRFHDSLPFDVWQKFTVHGYHNAIPFRIRFPSDVDLEVYRTHNAVTKLFMNDVLDGRSVHLHHFIEAVDERISRDCFAERATLHRILEQCLFDLSAQVKCGT